MATGLWKTPKPRFGLILRLPVNIYQKKFLMISINDLKKSDDYLIT